MKKMKFSVLMSVYKNEQPSYLETAIDSVYNQTLMPNEVILVEDGILSKNLEKIVKKCENKYSNLRVIRFKNNRGLGPALNDGINECKYDYIARMDTDDVCVNTRFEKQIKYLYDNPNVDIVGTNMIEYDSNMEKEISEKIVPENDSEIKKYAKKRNPMNHPTVIYKKKKILEVNGYDDYPYFEDYYLWSKMIKKGCTFHNIQENLYCFRGGMSMIKRRGGKKYLLCIKKFEKALLELKIINKSEYIKNLIIRYIFALIPNNTRRVLYSKILRKK